MAHGRDEQAGPEIVQAVVGAVRGLEDERSSFYFDLVLSSLGEAARRALEALMKSGNYEYQTEFVRKWIEEGLQKGRQKGRQEGEVIALLEVLDARGIEVGAEARQRIQDCTDPAQLKAWLRMAVKVDSVQQLFEEAPAPQPC
ncbi:hypothetical protein HPC49_32340 [Pyxidicoccus fallax]|uniref:Uncharacterized protein n=1 Tax=Pyxidicoccus fallax TaxID=394095 RepID=A0A848LKC0_9BACT|nr:hypothetical protein [Pyxidicoccus fallax]NMO18171.1 hypothetical protein [Pyxidicoccus fallax]NPC82899.1 hypothetical protein [Pyxidicoccus fallax]